jgi:hypothetical protein
VIAPGEREGERGVLKRGLTYIQRRSTRAGSQLYRRSANTRRCRCQRGGGNSSLRLLITGIRAGGRARRRGRTDGILACDGLTGLRARMRGAGVAPSSFGRAGVGIGGEGEGRGGGVCGGLEGPWVAGFLACRGHWKISGGKGRSRVLGGKAATGQLHYPARGYECGGRRGRRRAGSRGRRGQRGARWSVVGEQVTDRSRPISPVTSRPDDMK